MFSLKCMAAKNYDYRKNYPLLGLVIEVPELLLPPDEEFDDGL